MNRRDFMLLTAAVSTVPALGYASVDYTQGPIEKHLAAGEPVYVDLKTYRGRTFPGSASPFGTLAV